MYPEAIDAEPIHASRTMREKFFREVVGAGLPTSDVPSANVSHDDVAALPPTVRRYLTFMEVEGRPRIWSFRAHGSGVFRRSPSDPWMRCEAWQYDSRLEIARIFHMRLRFRGIVPLYVRDLYLRGRGHMLGRVFDAFSVADDSSDKIAIGELVTFLNDAILFAPSMLLGTAVWRDVDDSCFEVALADYGRTVTARVFVDERGAATDFYTDDRYGEDPDRPGVMVRTPWSTPVRGWARAEGRPVATGGKAVWHFPAGDFTYADFHFAPADIEFDVAPDSHARWR